MTQEQNVLCTQQREAAVARYRYNTFYQQCIDYFNIVLINHHHISSLMQILPRISRAKKLSLLRRGGRSCERSEQGGGLHSSTGIFVPAGR